MISVKATKAKTPESDPAERYVLKTEPRNSRTPYIVGAALSAIALYLKSAVSSLAGQEREGDGREPSDIGASLTSEDPVSAQQTAPDDAPDEPEAMSSDGFSFAPKLDLSNVRVSSGADFRESIKISGSRKMAANTDGTPASGPHKLDYSQLFGDTAEFADAWLPEQAAKIPFGVDDGPDNRNRSPRSGRPTYLLDVASGAAVFIAVSDLLANFTDPDGDTLAIIEASVSSGMLIAVEGGFVFRSDPDALGPVQLSFTVSDGQASVVDVALFEVVPHLVEGTVQDDMVSGTRFSDVIRGLDGNDYINALSGGDIIDGGAGDDTILGGAGDDQIFGGAGNDYILGGAGDDRISGGDGDDRLFGGEGNDILFGDAGDDVLSDGTGEDAAFGGDGDDLVIASADAQNDLFDGGTGHDTLDYSNAASNMNVDLVAHLAKGDDVGSDTITGFEIIILGSGDDHIMIGAEEVTLTGGGGANTFEFVDLAPGYAQPVTTHQILDFDFGDVIKTSKHKIFKKSDDDDDDDDLFDAMNGGGRTDDDSGRIRYRYENYDDDREETIVEWDNDHVTLLTVVALNGHHVLMWSDYA